MRFFESLGSDVRYALRTLWRSPLFTVVALLTLTIGIGATVAVFSVVNSVLLNPLRYPDADRLVAVWHDAPGAEGFFGGRVRTSASMYFTYAEENRTFDSIGVWTDATATVTGLAEPEQVPAAIVSDGLLQALAVPPALGRWLTAADQQPGAAAAIVIGYGYWQRRFGGRPDVLGRSITVNSAPVEIVGVMPRGFRIANWSPDLIAPFRFDRSRLRLPTFDYSAVARLKPGATLADANADIARMLPIWQSSWQPFPGGAPASFYSDVWRMAPAARALKDEVVGSVGDVLWVVMGTVAIVLLVACANVTNLLLVRAEGRQRELAVRAALGAGVWRIGRVPLLESALLGLAGGALGLALASGGLDVLVAIAPRALPRVPDIALDGRAVGFAVLVALLAGLVPGVVPALKHAAARTSTGLQSGSRGGGLTRETRRTQSILVIAQVALALVLLVNAGLMIRTFEALQTVEPGFTAPGQLQAMRISIPALLVPEPARVTRMQNDIIDALARIPGAESAGFTSQMPLEDIFRSADGVAVQGKPRPPGDWPVRRFAYVSPGILKTAGTKLLAGRDLTWDDLYGLRGAVLISENFAHEVWGTPEAALGGRLGGVGEIVGVVQNVREDGLTAPAPALIYRPALRDEGVLRSATFVVRSPRAGTEAFVREVQQAVWSVNPNLPVSRLRTMQDVYDGSLTRTTLTLGLLAVASGVALVLGVIGLYGVLAYAVARRRREIAIRLALGAQQRAVTRSVVRQGVALAGIGIALGLVAALAVTRLLASLLYGVQPTDAMTYASVALVLTAVAALASWLPARRAAAVDPAEALAAE
ncbi:MAG TPA: ABC transporter permease [Gammaproteobacteria bacterium]|nr:ABC transporter permease [Gammaproteobacteria bacterium]